ncbi:TetR/AcrR family transcriptional regulator [Mycolicibacterium novocastrense]|uniref:Transcriptional regulator n=1 Tax=Mycolicibacterium novocastrense TaxID=59813 RepID=A0AAW5SF48_MYCNV|nr:TetR/AcrR family transcriptional regulator [Mycolicibacterium novocastrense]MCV7021951.1 TetR/AcrR family transcriptional regulator [Mycolicibacterium novocastrense]GAT11119.1 transcriptional regulator [Mycolicibacterium novocastrense]
MSAIDRPLRADALRNRARVLEVAYDAFAADGLSVPIDEIARRAGVGAGTVYRHFPTKVDLYRAVVENRIESLVAEGRTLTEGVPPGEALFVVLRSLVLHWGAADRGLKDAIAGEGIDVAEVIPQTERTFLEFLAGLLKAAQDAGTARRDVDVRDVKAILAGCFAIQDASPEQAQRLTEVVLDGLRAA